MEDIKWSNHTRREQADHARPHFQGPAWVLRGNGFRHLYRVLVLRRDGFYYCTAPVGAGVASMTCLKLEGVNKRDTAKAVCVLLAKME